MTELQFVGYALALLGAFFYNYQKVVAAQKAAALAAKEAAGSQGGAEDYMKQGNDSNARSRPAKASIMVLCKDDNSWSPQQQPGPLKAVWPDADKV